MSVAVRTAQMWNERYSPDGYAYGKSPNVFYSTRLEDIDPGRILLPGEGEGRNAVYAASIGWKVDAFDQSSSGKIKALSLASEKDVEINYMVCNLEDYHFKHDYYDAVGLIYFHPDPSLRALLHKNVYETLKPGGSLILEAFHKDQLNRNSGGPRSLDLLFDEEMLLSDFRSFEFRLFEKKKILLNEGRFHHGEASVIRLHGIKPNYTG